MTSALSGLASRYRSLLLPCLMGLAVFSGILLAGWLTQRTVHVQIRLDTPIPGSVKIYCRTAAREGFGEAKCITVPTSGTPAAADVFVPAHQLCGLKFCFGPASGEFTILGGIVGNIPLPPWKYWSFSPNIIVQGDVGETLKLHFSDDGADHYMQVSFRRPIPSASRPRILSRGRLALLLPLALAAALVIAHLFAPRAGMSYYGKGTVAFLGWICLLSVMFFFFVVGIRMASCGVDMADHVAIADNIIISDLCHPISFWRHNYYPMWHLLVRLLKLMFHLESSVIAAGLANGFCYNACLIGIYAYLKRVFQNVNPCYLVLMAFIVCTCGCMMGPWVEFNYLYENTHNSWHNPTNAMVKTLALPCVLFTASMWDGLLVRCRNLTHMPPSKTASDRWLIMPWPQVIALGVILTLTELAKPSFIQVYLPAMFLFFAGWFLVDRKSIVPSLVLSLSWIAPCLVLLSQYMLAFEPGNDGGIGFGFMKVIGRYKHAGLNQFYAIAFPLAALATSLLRRKLHTEDILCWLMLLVGTGMRLFLFEQGPRMIHGNLGWGHAVALYLVWVMSVRQYVDLAISQKGLSSRLGFWTLSILLVLHELTGFWKMYEMMCLGRWL